MQSTIEIDGSFGEGGGQIIRTSLSLSILTGKSFKLINIRSGRTKPGLQPQHLAAVRAAAIIANASLEGDTVSSQRLVFSPQAKAVPGQYRFDIGTAGSISLVAQTLIPPLAFANGNSSVAITGGTHVPHSPVTDYVAHIYGEVLRRTGICLSVRVDRNGFFPKGGGEMTITTQPGATIRPVNMTNRGKLVELKAVVATGSLPSHVAERGASTIYHYMKGIGREITVETSELYSFSPGAAVLVTAKCENGVAGFTSLGERGKPMEKVSTEACEQFMDWWKTGASCDEHLSDQLVPLMAIAKEESQWTTPQVTEHLRTVLWTANRFVPIAYKLEPFYGGTTLVTLKPLDGGI